MDREYKQHMIEGILGFQWGDINCWSKEDIDEEYYSLFMADMDELEDEVITNDQ